ncbi:MAG: nucleotidyltransferase family protein [Porticoccaceae bacterium]|nr:nucleotidyltransferase family protein [Porticoccaceae bacterium]
MNLAALILAAGAGSRFGSTKQLVDIDGKPMLQHCIDSTATVLPESTYTVLGNQSETIAGKICNTQIIYNPDWRKGIGHSIATGVGALKEGYQGILILLADQPNIKHYHLTQLIQLFNGHNTVCSFYAGERGVPAIFPQSQYNDLMALRGDYGAKRLLQTMNNGLQTLSLAEAILDIDTPDDLENLSATR